MFCCRISEDFVYSLVVLLGLVRTSHTCAPSVFFCQCGREQSPLSPRTCNPDVPLKEHDDDDWMFPRSGGKLKGEWATQLSRLK